MTPEAFLFYFPAFMKMSLLEYHAADAVPDTVIRKLLIAAQDERSEIRETLDRYNDVQKKAVAIFLDEMSRRYWKLYPNDDAKDALDKYWARSFVWVVEKESMLRQVCESFPRG